MPPLKYLFLPGTVNPFGSPNEEAKKWLSNELFQLDQSPKAIVMSPTAWLTDDIIDAVQKLLI